MQDYQVNELLDILDKYEISLDIDALELSLLPNGLVDFLKTLNTREAIAEVLLAHINILKYKLVNNYEKDNNKTL